MHNALLQNKAKIMGNGCYATIPMKKDIEVYKMLAMYVRQRHAESVIGEQQVQLKLKLIIFYIKI